MNDKHVEPVKDKQSVTQDWMPLQSLIDGVLWREVKHVCRPSGGVLTELFRRDWFDDPHEIDQVFQNLLEPGQISGWHMHAHTTDRLFVYLGTMHVVLFDGREESPSHQVTNEFCMGTLRPGLLVVPPGVWHAVKNICSSPAALLNMVDHAYHYHDPDHWRLPLTTELIPFRFP